ncbi:cytochrome P450 [Hyphococcus luteus]|uniref:Cytochrome P450 n=1 Tax=Hyphococcus luteus TaxID=2058213 RepID=A0A2S7K235_9PROT|nr:cytochrome P450 [Marinicaulis flavus]PQA86546.1 hypothetical protein CW354_19690 [Marinicaulis flavus]
MTADVAALMQDREVFLEALDADPYSVYRALREKGPIHWIEPLKMWYVVDHRHIHEILMNAADFVTGTPHSLLYDTFGEHMLTVDGAAHFRYRSAFRGAFTPKTIQENLSARIERRVDELIDGFVAQGETDLRDSIASRLPVLTILEIFGLPLELEQRFRNWYDSFEAALSNFSWDAACRQRAAKNREEFHEVLQGQIETLRGSSTHGLLSSVVNGDENRLSDAEIRRNALIIMFGGISTVEALLLNTVYAILSQDFLRLQVDENPEIIPAVVEESVRWVSPVQSATRHVANDIEFAGVSLKAGDIVNCMLGAANRDPAIFEDPDKFILNRNNIRKHLGFAIGPHVCLGNNLARLEAKTAIEKLMARLDGLKLKDAGAVAIRGYEFRQPKRLDLVWTPKTA